LWGSQSWLPPAFKPALFAKMTTTEKRPMHAADKQENLGVTRRASAAESSHAEWSQSVGEITSPALTYGPAASQVAGVKAI